MDKYAADWLAMRAPYDDAARRTGLMARFADALPRRPTVIDLGCGTGAAPRAFAGYMAAETRWIGVDGDEDLLRRYPAETRRVDLASADLDALFAEADAVVAAAFLDLASKDWMRRFAAAARGRPVWCSSVVDGRRIWTPADDADAAIDAAFQTDQRRDKGLGPALGPDAPDGFRAAFADSHDIRMERADWRIGGDDRPMLDAMIDGMAGVADAPDWAARRRALADARALTLTVGHQDLLALPKAG